MKTSALAIVLLLLLTGCEAPTSREQHPPLPEAISVAATEPARDTAAAATVRRFLDWYTSHTDSLSTSRFVTDADSLTPYAVDFAGTDKWLQQVQRSQLVSSTYLHQWRAYFRRYADSLRLHPQYDGPPDGFEYDFIMLSQEPDEVAAELKAGTFQTLPQADNRVRVQVTGVQHDGWRAGMRFSLTHQPSGQWLIDSMSVR